MIIGCYNISTVSPIQSQVISFIYINLMVKRYWLWWRNGHRAKLVHSFDLFLIFLQSTPPYLVFFFCSSLFSTLFFDFLFFFFFFGFLFFILSFSCSFSIHFFSLISPKALYFILFFDFFCFLIQIYLFFFFWNSYRWNLKGWFHQKNENQWELNTKHLLSYSTRIRLEY